MKNNKLKNQRGITLVALVLTIILMILLAAATIVMAINGGLFNYAGRAVGETKNAIANEQEFANLEANMTADELRDKYTNSQGGTGSGVIPVPDEEDVYLSFDVGKEEGTVTAYLVENEEATEENPVYDMLVIGNGAMLDCTRWDNTVVKFLLGSSDSVRWNVKIKNLIISEGVTAIGDRTCWRNKDIESVVIPNSVTNIGNYAFDGCTNLANVTIPDSITSVGYEVLSGTKWFENQEDGLIYVGKVAYKYKGEMEENTNIVIKEGTKTIADEAFSNCTNLTSITIPADLYDVSPIAFEYCNNLTTINYRGTEEQWGEKTLYLSEEEFLNPTINYNYNG